MYMSTLMARTRPRYWQHSIILPCYIYMSAWMIRTGCRYCDDGSFLADEDCWKGWWSVLAYSLMAVETDSWCAPSTALWTVLGSMDMSVHLDIDSTAKRLLFHSPIQIASTEILYRNFFFIAQRVLKWLFPNPERLPFFLKKLINIIVWITQPNVCYSSCTGKSIEIRYIILIRKIKICL